MQAWYNNGSISTFSRHKACDATDRYHTVQYYENIMLLLVRTTSLHK